MKKTIKNGQAKYEFDSLEEERCYQHIEDGSEVIIKSLGNLYFNYATGVYCIFELRNMAEVHFIQNIGKKSLFDIKCQGPVHFLGNIAEHTQIEIKGFSVVTVNGDVDKTVVFKISENATLIFAKTPPEEVMDKIYEHKKGANATVTILLQPSYTTNPKRKASTFEQSPSTLIAKKDSNNNLFVVANNAKADISSTPSSFKLDAQALDLNQRFSDASPEEIEKYFNSMSSITTTTTSTSNIYDKLLATPSVAPSAPVLKPDVMHIVAPVVAPAPSAPVAMPAPEPMDIVPPVVAKAPEEASATKKIIELEKDPDCKWFSSLGYDKCDITGCDEDFITYVDSFKRRKYSTAEQIKRLVEYYKLSEEEQKKYFSEIKQDESIELDYMNIPCFYQRKYYDLKTILELKENPHTRKPINKSAIAAVDIDEWEKIVEAAFINIPKDKNIVKEIKAEGKSEIKLEIKPEAKPANVQQQPAPIAIAQPKPIIAAPPQPKPIIAPSQPKPIIAAPSQPKPIIAAPSIDINNNSQSMNKEFNNNNQTEDFTNEVLKGAYIQVNKSNVIFTNTINVSKNKIDDKDATLNIIKGSRVRFDGKIIAGTCINIDSSYVEIAGSMEEGVKFNLYGKNTMLYVVNQELTPKAQENIFIAETCDEETIAFGPNFEKRAPSKFEAKFEANNNSKPLIKKFNNNNKNETYSKEIPEYSEIEIENSNVIFTNTIDKTSALTITGKSNVQLSGNIKAGTFIEITGESYVEVEDSTKLENGVHFILKDNALLWFKDAKNVREEIIKNITINKDCGATAFGAGFEKKAQSKTASPSPSKAGMFAEVGGGYMYNSEGGASVVMMGKIAHVMRNGKLTQYDTNGVIPTVISDRIYLDDEDITDDPKYIVSSSKFSM